MKSINPTTGELIKEYPEHSEEEVSEILELVQSDWEQWRKTSFDERAGYMKKAANLIALCKKKLQDIDTDTKASCSDILK